EEGLRLLRLDAAPGHHPRQELRQAVPLRDHERARLAARIEAVAPYSPGRGFLHAEEGVLLNLWQRQRRHEPEPHTGHAVRESEAFKGSATPEASGYLA